MSAVRAALCAVLLVVLTGCAGAGADRAHIVVTTNILGDITRNIVGDEARVTVLMKPNADPHSFGIAARQAADLENAGLVVHNGLGLEEGMARHVEAARESGVATVAVGEHIDPISYRADESEGEPDPHFWTDPVRVRTAVEVLAERIGEEVSGVDSGAIQVNAERYLRELDELHTWMAERFDGIGKDGRTLVTNHHVFGYLAARYDFRVVGAVVPSGTTLASPSASDLSELAGTIREAGVPAIFADSSQPDRLARVLAEQAGLHVEVLALFSESLSERDGPAGTYLDMMRANTDTIVSGLRRGDG
ncbi:ABC transporter substrate-binding protein [Prauserella marina]|uniref:Zinc/manganese transport system substrate-binding protein n=1 Tax=Prauserella marina TaxID=530584 RepID=A0A222VNZ8_9PSEU|nr:zinc ABC transporter substrate-binding protein AztC [Prauserella marina]ASR35639.1 ABC transporter substrate-binding protein [Prauserella marina]PWV84493.1 zinc/manganese transport system substrate-binding protein [Prauserella marina]SDC21080.1 zinc/manganese transport system substrate-binding protein [Prauserella marina]